MHLYRMLDAPDASKAAILVASKDEAKRYNEQGYGIFVSVNSFTDGVRRREHLTRINAWAIDIDDGSKDQQRKRLHSSPLVPSFVVETKRGFQAYWAAKDAHPETWNALVLERLVPFFGADKNARDLCRILRKPGYLHLKDPADPFLVRVVWRHAVSYSEKQIAQAFRWVPDKRAQKQQHDDAKSEARRAAPLTSDSLWDAIYQLDCEEGLRRLSGHSAVRGESFTFRRTSKGNLNIYVDGKSSPCFVDENKRIGSPSGGGPTLVQWLRWYGHDYKYVLETLKQVFPQLAEIDERARKQWAASQQEHRQQRTQAGLPSHLTVVDGAAA